MKLPRFAHALVLAPALAACGGGAENKTAAEPATVDAVTAEAVRDTRAATNDAAAAADAELDRLSNSIDPAPAAGKAGDRVSNTTAVTIY